MRNLLAISLVLAASAASASLPDIQGPLSALRASVAASRQAWDEQHPPMRVSAMDVAGCWEREADADADALGLPPRVCLRRVGVEIPVPHELPFVQGSSMLLDSDLASGKFHVSGGARRSDGWDIVGSFLEVSDPKRGCGVLDTAFITADIAIDLKGNLQPRRPRLFGHLMDSDSLCRAQAKGRYFEYRQAPR